MGRKRKITVKEPKLSKSEQVFSFDLDTVLYLSGLKFEERRIVEKRMVEISENKKCIPLSVAKAVVKELGFNVKPRET